MIESLFGKFKQIEKNHASEGLTSLVLALPALVGKLSEEMVKKAMENVSMKQVEKWVKEHLGSTFCSQRRNSLNAQENIIDDVYLESDDFNRVFAS